MKIIEIYYYGYDDENYLFKYLNIMIIAAINEMIYLELLKDNKLNYVLKKLYK